MNPIKMVLLCNVGASSAFLANRIRKAFTAKNIEIEISSQAFSGTTTMDKVDLVLIAPQLKFMEEEVIKLCRRFNKPYHIVSQEFYGFKEGYDVTQEILKTLDEFNSKEQEDG